MAEITAAQLRDWLYGDAELALLDVREAGQAVRAHILFSAPAPYSRFEAMLPALVPNTDVRMVLCDAGDGVAGRAALRARAMGYAQVHTLAGGVDAWAVAGYTLYQGVNVPSKAFGELIEHADDTPRLPAAEVARMQAENADMVIVDGRPFEEFNRFNIPGGGCCPNGELAVRIRSIAPDPATTIVVNCAGRTRSIIGAQTLRELGVPNPVYAMENGTQGWVLAGLDLARGSVATLAPMADDLSDARASAQAYATREGVTAVATATVADWIEQGRTVFLADVRTSAERAADGAGRAADLAAGGVVHAPGGQLVQATDQWIGVRRAKVVVLDTEDIRARVIAAWLRRLGHDACVLQGGVDAVAGLPASRAPDPGVPMGGVMISATDLLTRLSGGGLAALDLRSSAAFLKGHVPGAQWATRPRLTAAGPVALIADDPAIAALAARDLAEAGIQAMTLQGGMAAWRTAGLPEQTGGLAEDARIDFLSFTHGRHDGNQDAMRQYLSWEIALVDQLDTDERAVFRV